MIYSTSRGDLGLRRFKREDREGLRASQHKLARAVGGHALLNQNVNRAKLLGFRESDLDEVRVTLGDGSQSRTFVIGKDRTPAVRYLLSEASEPTPDDAKFRQRVSTEALDLFSAVGGSWQTAWEQSSPTTA